MRDSHRRTTQPWIARVAIAIGLTAATIGAASAQDFRIIDRFAGGSNGDGGPAVDASINPGGVISDSAGNLYVADTSNHRVRRYDAATGFISTVAGTGSSGYSGDGGQATAAYLNAPVDIALDTSGNLYISDRGNQRVRRVDPISGIITTVAGTGVSGFTGDGGAATSARLASPGGIAVGIDGTLYIADTSNQRIRKVSNGQISTFAGNGTFGFAGDGGVATNARLALPSDVTVGSDGEVYIADFANQRIRMVESGRISTIAGSGVFAMCDNVPALQACFRNPIAIQYDPTEGVLYVADAANHRLRRVPVDGGLVTTVAGTGTDGFNGDGILASIAWLHGPSGVAVHPNLGLFVSDQFNDRVRRIPRGVAPIIQTVIGNGNLPFGGDGGPAIGAKFNAPAGLAHDASGRIYLADTGNHRVRRIDTDGTIATIAGSGAAGYTGDGGPATSAALNSPADVAVDRAGNVYISDKSNNRVRRVTPSGTISTILGNGAPQSSGDGGPATSASTPQPSALAVYENASGSQRFLYVVESAQNKVRVVDLNANRVSRFAGTGTFGFSGDGGNAADAKLAIPQDVATDTSGNVYIADTFNQRIRRVSSNGTMSTFAGNGGFGYAGDGGPAIEAKLASPGGVAVGPFGNVLIVDVANYRVRVVDTSGVITTAMGTGTETGRVDGEGGNPIDDLGDGGPANEASFKTIASITYDGDGNAFVVDNPRGTIRWVEDLAGLWSNEDPQVASVFGSVRYATSGLAVPSVTVRASGPSQETAATGSGGGYGLESLASGDDWTLEPFKNGGYASSVISPLDAAYVLQDLVNTRNLTSAQRMACDVTGDGDLSPLDATRILQRALGSTAPFAAAVSCGSDWLFEPNAATAPNQTQAAPQLDGGTFCRPGAIEFNPLNSQADRQDFTAVIIGDCTANWTPSGGATAAMTSAMSRSGAATGASVVIGRERRTRRMVRVPVSIESGGSFSALQIDLGYDAGSLRPKRIVRRGAARSAIAGWREKAPGELTIVLASGSEIATPARTALILDFEVTDSSDASARNAVHSARAQIDENDVGVRVTRRVRRR